jgi:Mce-associated membrane protein
VSGPWKVLVAVVALLAVGAVGAAGWFGYKWWTVSRHDTAEVVAARDGALRAARDLAVTLQSVDPAQPDQGMRAWQAAATGPLLEQLQRDQAKFLEQLKKVPTRSTASVQDAALTEMNPAAGTATAIAALDVTQSVVTAGRPSQPTLRKLRVKLTLNRTDAGWKVASSGLVNA